MLIKLEELSSTPLVMERKEPITSFPELERIGRTNELTFSDAVDLLLHCSQVDGFVEVCGRLELTVEGICSRCLAPAVMPISSDFTLTYTSGSPGVSDEETGDEIELSAEEMNLISFHGDEINLATEIQEQIIIALPVKPLCREECRGLCPRCGTDLNQQPCVCEPEVFNSRFDVLRKLKS